MNKVIIIFCCFFLHAPLFSLDIVIKNNNNQKVTQRVTCGDQEFVKETIIKPTTKNQKKIVRSSSNNQAQSHEQTFQNGSIKITNNNNAHIKQAAHVHQQPAQNLQQPIISFPLAQPQTLMQQAKNQASSILLRGNYFFGFLGACYVGLLAKLLYESRILSNKKNWGAWKEDVPLEILYNSEKKVAHELFDIIQAKYANKLQTSNFLSPLVYFINDIDYELARHHYFLQLHAWLKKYKLSYILPEQKNAINRSTNYIKKLEFLKQVIIKWVGEYKAEAPAL